MKSALQIIRKEEQQKAANKERKTYGQVVNSLKKEHEIVCLNEKAYIAILAIAVEQACYGVSIKAKVTKGY